MLSIYRKYYCFFNLTLVYINLDTFFFPDVERQEGHAPKCEHVLFEADGASHRHVTRKGMSYSKRPACRIRTTNIDQLSPWHMLSNFSVFFLVLSVLNYRGFRV